MKAVFTVEELVDLMSSYRTASIRKQEELRQAARQQQHLLRLRKAKMETTGKDPGIVDQALVALADFLAFTDMEDTQQVDYMISIQTNPHYHHNGRTK